MKTRSGTFAGKAKMGGRFLSLPYSFWVTALADMAAISLSLLLGYCLRIVFPGSLPPDVYLQLLLLSLVLFPFLFASLGLYPGNLDHPAVEIKSLARGTSIGFMILAASFFLLKNADTFSRSFFLGSWFLALFLIPLSRSYTRSYFSRFDWWKTPLILIGGCHSLKPVHKPLRTSQKINLYPVVMVRTDCDQDQIDEFERPDGVDARILPPDCERHALNTDEEAFGRLCAEIAIRFPGATVAVLMPSISQDRQERILELVGEHFYKIMLIEANSWDYCIPERVINLGDSFGLAVRKNLCDPRRLCFKRCFDLFLSCIVGLFSLPVALVLAVAIRLDSPGTILFGHTRIGQNGRPFTVYKFRTMYQDSDAILQTYLAEHPEEAEEWTRTQKLRNDPRVSGVGRFLRRTSLDELPQLLNIFTGTMSLVGPRPIVESEIRRYGDIYPMYTKVLPGITGLWQVSGRNDISYPERVSLDKYYISNWSIWLDLYILVKTVPEVLKMRGAY